jgi:tetrahydromethanopterin S-methyltransferase subunit F
MTINLRRPRLGITARIYLGVIIGLLSAFLLSSVLIWSKMSDLIELTPLEEIEENGLSFQHYFSRQIEDLGAVGNWFARQDRLKELVKGQDSAALAGFFIPWVRSSLLDSVTVVDANGQVIARIVKNEPLTQGDNVYDKPGIKEALAGVQSNGLDQDAAGRAEGTVIVPMYDDGHYAPIGLLILGFYVDGAYLKEVTITHNMEIVIAFKDRITTSSLSETPNQSWIGEIVPASVLASE